ncbi:MAG: SH3 domain-containing protein, partial [Clostridia bacterium]|nr:SH3 domain-containing protein [Clostridia bacterium]
MKKQLLSIGLAAILLCQASVLPLTVLAEGSDTPEESGSSITEDTSPTSPEEVVYTHQISEAGVELIKSFEGFARYAVWDYKQYSIGYGSYVESPDVYPDGITEREASELLCTMIDDFNVYLNKFLEDNQILLNQNQFDALASFGYNLGKYVWTARDYEFIRMLKSGEYLTDRERFIEAYCSICHAGGQFLQGLYDRRMREMNIFFSEYDLSDDAADLYVVNVTDKLSIRKEPTTSSTRLGTVAGSKVIRVHEYSEDGKWAYTSYCGYFGWVSMDYLVSIDEEEMVTITNDDGYDDSGIHY